MVLFSDLIEGLQNMLRTLNEYTSSWKLTVNTNKINNTVFRNRGKIRENERWSYENEVL